MRSLYILLYFAPIFTVKYFSPIHFYGKFEKLYVKNHKIHSLAIAV